MWIETAFNKSLKAHPRDAMQLLDMMLDHLKVYMCRVRSQVACIQLVSDCGNKDSPHHVLFSWEIQSEDFQDAWLIGYDAGEKQWSVVSWDYERKQPTCKRINKSELLNVGFRYVEFARQPSAESFIQVLKSWGSTREIPCGVKWNNVIELVEQAMIYLDRSHLVCLIEPVVRSKL